MTKNKEENWFMRHKIITAIGIILLLFIFIGILTPSDESDKSNNQNKGYQVIEKLKISCDGPAGESFYLLTSPTSFDIINTGKITCEQEVEVLERLCVQNEGSYEGDMIEMDKIKQGNLIGWAMRKDLTCQDMYCNYALDSIC